MESWSIYGSEMKGSVLSDEMASPNDALSRSRKFIPSWDLKTPYNYSNNMPVLGHEEASERDLFMELGFSDSIRKSISDNTVKGVSFSVVDSNSHHSPLIDLKLGNLSDYRDGKDGKYAKEMRVYSSIVSAVPAKRSRSANLNAQIPFCQVLGCNMDLSSSKDYHKRHKVCDVHSKTAKVIVNGVEQRFCQQCSRFHLLDEFDEGKRSCRKRLAGHNERRRKPQIDNHSRKNGKLIPSFQGDRFLGTSLQARTSLLFPDMFPGVGLPEAKYENSNWSRHIKSETDEIYNTPTPLPITNEHLFPKPFNPLYSVDLIGSNSASRSLFNSPSGNEEFTVFNTASNIQGIPKIPNSGCALSLLSSQSHNSSTRSSEVSISQPLIIQGGHPTAHNNMGLFPNKHFAASLQGSTGVEDDHLAPVLVSNPVEFEVQANRFFQGFDFVNRKDPPTSNDQDGHTIDLLQLSSQLQRVEHQRSPVQVKQENEVFCYFPAT